MTVAADLDLLSEPALVRLVAAWSGRTGTAASGVGTALLRAVLVALLADAPPGVAVQEAAGGLGVLRAWSGGSPGALAEEVLALRAVLRPLLPSGADARLGDCLDLAVPAAVAAHAREQAPAGSGGTRDALTGLLSRPVFGEAVAHEVEAARRHGAPSVVVAELDGLVPWTERHGNLAGDLHVVRLVQAVRDSSRRSDVACRLSADSVGLLLPRTGLDRALVVAQRVLVRGSGAGLSGTGADAGLPRLHVGLAFLPEPRSAEAVLAEAERTLREARRAGGGQVAHSRPLPGREPVSAP